MMTNDDILDAIVQDFLESYLMLQPTAYALDGSQIYEASDELDGGTWEDNDE